MSTVHIFKTPPAQHIYNDYMMRIERCLSALPSDLSQELLLEYQSHIYEATRGCEEQEEFSRLTDVLGKLGSPEEFLQPVIAGKSLERATRTFNPVDVFRAIYLNSRHGVIFTVFGLLYLFLFAFVIIAIGKIIFPAHTGLFFDDSGFRAFGFYFHSENATDVLGYWIIPVSLITASVLYFLITLMLRCTRKK